jgi:hypothetical protein
MLDATDKDRTLTCLGLSFAWTSSDGYMSNRVTDKIIVILI